MTILCINLEITRSDPRPHMIFFFFFFFLMTPGLSEEHSNITTMNFNFYM